MRHRQTLTQQRFNFSAGTTSVKGIPILEKMKFLHGRQV